MLYFQATDAWGTVDILVNNAGIDVIVPLQLISMSHDSLIFLCIANQKSELWSGFGLF